MNRSLALTFSVLLVGILVGSVAAQTAGDVQARIDSDVARGSAIVVHVVVALCDNANQGIVPVSSALGDGQNPRTNLYWGALYGVNTHFPRAGWTRIPTNRPDNPRILDRSIFHASLKRGDATAQVYVIADAWDGAHIREALQAHFEMVASGLAEQVDVPDGSGTLVLKAGGDSHLLAYVGHNWLMEFSLGSPAREEGAARSAIVLACASKPYFLERLANAGAHPLLLTTGLMAPEAYTLDSAIRSWAGGGDTAATVEAAATAYNRYQKCGLKAARKLFWGAP